MSGFSTLNRFLGKKNKDKTSSKNGKFSKSNTNLSISSTNLSEPSQLEYNRITPLPIATSNAPFEQTFRITVLLPKDQLYVCRLGARIQLSKLLELVCENKLLDADKYEFRNPVDPSQVYSCELTIGAVGLSEIRLCHKTESYDNFNPDEVIKLNRAANIRDSLSSSEYSSRLNKSQATKTPSPYSSSNSLNSMDSTGMNTRTPMIATATAAQMGKNQNSKIAPPPRKKRAAPRPPTQGVIPEKGPLEMTNGNLEETVETLKSPDAEQILKKDYFLSTPNLTSAHADEIDCNGNVQHLDTNEIGIVQQSPEEEEKNSRNLYRGSVNDLSLTIAKEGGIVKLPEPSPRKRLILMKKKTVAPAPPPRNSLYRDTDDEDALSIASTNPSINGLTPMTPDNSAATTPNIEENKSPIPEEAPSVSPSPLQRDLNKSNVTLLVEGGKIQEIEIPKPVPRQMSTTTLLNATAAAVEHLEVPNTESSKSAQPNVSKVLLNRTPTPEPRSLSTEPPELDLEEDDNASKQADSGIGEPVPSPIPDSLPSEGSAHECKSNFESSSDDDDMIKVYNFKLGTTVKPKGQLKTLEELNLLSNANVSGESTPTIVNQETATPSSSDTTSWNFTIPISPPPNFADSKKNLKENPSSADSPIQPKIVERPKLNFEVLNADSLERKQKVLNKKEPITPVPSPSSPLNEIVEELSAIISEKKIDSLIKQPKEQQEIEAAKPNTLSNFSISTIGDNQTLQNYQNNQQKETKIIITNEQSTSKEIDPMKPNDIKSPKTEETKEKLNSQEEIVKEEQKSPELVESTIVSSSKKGANIIGPLTSLQQKRKSLTRADSFQFSASLTKQSSVDSSTSLNSRSSSHLCLNKIEGNSLQAGKRSSSELSIGESPSLQSLEIIKTILNSRKNSLSNNSEATNKDREEAIQKTIQMAEETLRSKAAKEENHLSFEEKDKDSEAFDDSLQSKEIPKTYRYSGPPSINFSTWNERPKFQVSIKNEGDYIFGGKQNQKTLPRNNRLSMPAESLQREESHISNPESPIVRMGIPEEDFKVPITVKPLKDVVCEGPANEASSQIVLGKPPKPPKVIPEHHGFATLPRNSGSKKLTTPLTTASSIPGPSSLRTTSFNKADSLEKKFNSSKENEASSVPFGQGTLRKTGLKEKILAKDQSLETDNNENKKCTISTQTSKVIHQSFSHDSNSNKTVQTSTTTLHLNSPTTSNRISFSSNPHSINTNSFQEDPTPSPVKAKKVYFDNTGHVIHQLHNNNNNPSNLNESKPNHFATTTTTSISWRSNSNPNSNSNSNSNPNTKENINSLNTTINSSSNHKPIVSNGNNLSNGYISHMTLRSPPSKDPTAKRNLDLIIPKPKVFKNITVTNNIQIPKTAPAAPPAPPPNFNLKPLKAVPKSAGATPSEEDPRDALLAAIRNFKRNELKQAEAKLGY